MVALCVRLDESLTPRGPKNNDPCCSNHARRYAQRANRCNRAHARRDSRRTRPGFFTANFVGEPPAREQSSCLCRSRYALVFSAARRARRRKHTTARRRAASATRGVRARHSRARRDSHKSQRLSRLAARACNQQRATEPHTLQRHSAARRATPPAGLQRVVA